MNKYLLLVMLLFFGCTSNEELHDHSFYTCSMHPEIREEKPGKCPICHMNLTKVEVDKNVKEEVVTSLKEQWRCKDYPDVTSEKAEVCPLDGSMMVKIEKVGKVVLRKKQLKHFRPDYFLVAGREMKKKIRLLGTVIRSEDKESRIPARVEGRVEKVYVKSTGSFIRKGDPVLDYYSPRLITAGEEYLLARKSFSKNKGIEFKEMLISSRKRLAQWGIQKEQYERWYQTGVVPQRITIYSETTGIVQNKNAIVGKYFKEGENFFKISDLQQVWVEMDVYEHDAGLIKMDQDVSLIFSAMPGEILKGKIDFINPTLDSNSRTLKIRATVQNHLGKIKPGMVADATLTVIIEGKPLAIPRSAVIDTGKRKVVWIKKSETTFEARIIHTGYESEGYIEIKDGLQKNDYVVLEGNFLLDAQAQLFGGYDR